MTDISLQKLTEGGANDGEPINGQFNPASLQYTITNTARSGSGNQRSREVQDSVGKLTFDLIFDSTDTGSDVRLQTQVIARLMQPATHRKTPVVKVSWGAFVFAGALDQYRETLDYFAAEGVPLRATLSLGFTTVPVNNQTPPIVFTFAGLTGVTSQVQGQLAGSSDTQTVQIPVGRGAGRGRSAADVAGGLGAPGLARQIGAANGLEDIRNPIASGSLDVSAEPVLAGPVAFAAGGGASFGASAGFSAGAGAGIGIAAGAGIAARASISAGANFSAGASLGASAGAGASVGFGAGASFGASVGIGASGSIGANAGLGASASVGVSAGIGAGASIGASAGGSWSAGVSAASGAFARVGVKTSVSRGQLDLSRAFKPPPGATLTLSEDVEVGGRLRADGGSGFVADVGQGLRLRERIQFEED